MLVFMKREVENMHFGPRLWLYNTLEKVREYYGVSLES